MSDVFQEMSDVFQEMSLVYPITATNKTMKDAKKPFSQQRATL